MKTLKDGKYLLSVLFVTFGGLDMIKSDIMCPKDSLLLEKGD